MSRYVKLVLLGLPLALTVFATSAILNNRTNDESRFTTGANPQTRSVGRARNLSLQPEAFKMSRRLGSRFTSTVRAASVRNGDRWTVRFLTDDIQRLYEPENRVPTSKPVQQNSIMIFMVTRFFNIEGEMRDNFTLVDHIPKTYLNGELDDIEISATMHHELRAHVLLGDFGRNIPRSRHSDAYARGQGKPTTEADIVGEKAEKEARENAKNKP